MLLTIVLTVDAEKDPRLTWAFFSALARWNRKAMGRVQVLCICQKERDPETLRLAGRQPFPVDVVFARRPMVEGYPVWDVCAEARAAWGLVRGQYLTFAHAEFLWCAERIKKTLRFLEIEAPMLALGNLRRLHGPEGWKDRNSGRQESGEILRAMEAGDWHLAAAKAEYLPTRHWAWQPEQGPGAVEWQEDVFFARKDWLDSIRFLDHAVDLPFQDVYDLVGHACGQLGEYGVAPTLVRMPLEVNRLVHLWHPRLWGSWTPAMRRWFLSSPEYADTPFGRPETWERLLAASGEAEAAVAAIRLGRGGTVARFARRMADWLANGGVTEAATYHRRRS